MQDLERRGGGVGARAWWAPRGAAGRLAPRSSPRGPRRPPPIRPTEAARAGRTQRAGGPRRGAGGRVTHAPRRRRPRPCPRGPAPGAGRRRRPPPLHTHLAVDRVERRFRDRRSPFAAAVDGGGRRVAAQETGEAHGASDGAANGGVCGGVGRRGVRSGRPERRHCAFGGRRRPRCGRSRGVSRRHHPQRERRATVAEPPPPPPTLNDDRLRRPPRPHPRRGLPAQ